MKAERLKAAFGDTLKTVLLGLRALAEHFNHGLVEVHATLLDRDDEEGPTPKIIELRREDGEVLYSHTNEWSRDLLEGTMAKIFKANKAGGTGPNHEHCGVCIYIASCIEDQLRAMDMIREEVQRELLSAALQSKLDISKLSLQNPNEFAERLKEALQGSGFEVDAVSLADVRPRVRVAKIEEMGEDSGDEEDSGDGAPSNLTDAEMESLKACKSDEDWEAACENIKHARDGGYPPDWFPRVLASGLAKEIMARFGSAPGLAVETIDKDGNRKVIFDDTKAEN